MLLNRINMPQYPSGWYDAWDFVPDILGVLNLTEAEIDIRAKEENWKAPRQHMFMPWSPQFAKQIAVSASDSEVLRDLWKEFFARKITKDQKFGFPPSEGFVPEMVENELLGSNQKRLELLLPTFSKTCISIMRKRNALVEGFDKNGNEQFVLRGLEERKDIEGYTYAVRTADGADLEESSVCPDEEPEIYLVSRGAYKFSFVPDPNDDDRKKLRRHFRREPNIYSINLEAIEYFVNRALNEWKSVGTIEGRQYTKKVDATILTQILFYAIIQRWIWLHMTECNEVEDEDEEDEDEGMVVRDDIRVRIYESDRLRRDREVRQLDG
ncbi:hypothetical protein QBC40DRAFT_315940 [Triangularia verruculosa]|uniref:Uncharacterized protein n=1 Tax=Triangularia verruculosa TaxID=2587418 RepID=A0AAN7AS12_9PEZI|nr:hypothetical protein QBC40DRAFT_315940 [Triangularia verruculosa]